MPIIQAGILVKTYIQLDSICQAQVSEYRDDALKRCWLFQKYIWFSHSLLRDLLKFILCDVVGETDQTCRCCHKQMAPSLRESSRRMSLLPTFACYLNRQKCDGGEVTDQIRRCNHSQMAPSLRESFRSDLRMSLFPTFACYPSCQQCYGAGETDLVHRCCHKKMVPSPQ